MWVATNRSFFWSLFSEGCSAQPHMMLFYEVKSFNRSLCTWATLFSILVCDKFSLSSCADDIVCGIRNDNRCQWQCLCKIPGKTYPKIVFVSMFSMSILWKNFAQSRMLGSMLMVHACYYFKPFLMGIY